MYGVCSPFREIEMLVLLELTSLVLYFIVNLKKENERWGETVFLLIDL